MDTRQIGPFPDIFWFPWFFLGSASETSGLVNPINTEIGLLNKNIKGLVCGLLINEQKLVSSTR